MKTHASLLFSALIFAGTSAFAEGNPQRGKKLSNTCAACHGEKGISPNPVWPNLAGQKQQYLFLQLKAFKSGERKNELMSPLMKDLSEQDMQDLAAYYSQLK